MLIDDGYPGCRRVGEQTRRGQAKYECGGESIRAQIERNQPAHARLMWKKTLDAVPRFFLGDAFSAILAYQCLAVRGRGSWSAAFRRPQFKHAKTVMARPASKSTARSGSIVPRHLSHVFIDGTLAFSSSRSYPS